MPALFESKIYSILSSDIVDISRVLSLIVDEGTRSKDNYYFNDHYREIIKFNKLPKRSNASLTKPSLRSCRPFLPTRILPLDTRDDYPYDFLQCILSFIILGPRPGSSRRSVLASSRVSLPFCGVTRERDLLNNRTMEDTACVWVAYARPCKPYRPRQ